MENRIIKSLTLGKLILTLRDKASNLTYSINEKLVAQSAKLIIPFHKINHREFKTIMILILETIIMGSQGLCIALILQIVIEAALVEV